MIFFRGVRVISWSFLGSEKEGRSTKLHEQAQSGLRKWQYLQFSTKQPEHIQKRHIQKAKLTSSILSHRTMNVRSPVRRHYLMRRISIAVLFTLLTVLAVSPASGQENESAARIRIREQVSQLLEKEGPGLHIVFRQTDKHPFNFSGLLKEGLMQAESLEIDIGVSQNQTIGFRIYPRYKNGYINIDKVKNSAGLMRQLLRLTDSAFLFWGVDASGDVFTGYTFTLESGFPEESMKVVLKSILNSDKFIGEMKPMIDGSGTLPTKERS
jgi:hypothetical protein